MQSELHRVEEAIERNGRRIEEIKEDLSRRIEDTNHRIDGLRAEMLSRFDQQDKRFDEQARWFKFTYATMVLGLLAVLIKLFAS